jgi:hypothetical protein
MTVGLAQLKLLLWEEFMKTTFSKSPSIADWENPVINFLAVRWYLLQNEIGSSLLDISCIYTGQDNEFYAMLLSEALNLLKEYNLNSDSNDGNPLKRE